MASPGAAHGAFHMGRVFSAQRAGERISLKDWLEGIWQAPRWLQNRGVWSIFGQAVLGRTAYNYLRSLRNRGFVSRWLLAIVGGRTRIALRQFTNQASAQPDERPT